MSQQNDNTSLQSRQSPLLEGMLHELKTNVHFSGKSLHNNDHLTDCSSQLISELTQSLHSNSVPPLSSKQFKPLLKLWHHLLKEHLQHGFSTKDTAFMIYALRNSVLTQIKKTTDKTLLSELSLLSERLDFLGILTFEIFSAEKDRDLSLQSHQIEYLQQHQSQFSTNLIGQSPQMHAIYKMIGLVLENNVPVLLQGESGTGKDLIANIIHQHSTRKKHPFIAVNCAAIPFDLFESELFGHEKGAFTHAETQRIGKFELANHGTLFLDEIGDIPFDLQAKLLRAIQNKEIFRLGGSTPIPIDIRIISATNLNLEERVQAHQFKDALFYRLSVFPIHIPALRERQSDILPLAHHFIKHYSQIFSLTPPKLTKDAELFLINQSWKGNIRELENTIQRALIFSQGRPITRSFFDSSSCDLLSFPSPLSLSEPVKELTEPVLPIATLEKNAICNALKQFKGNIKKTAEALGICRTTLYNKMKLYAIIKDDSS